MNEDPRSSDVEVREVTAAAELAKVRSLELSIFRACGFSDISDYAVHDEQSIFFGAFASNSDCVGMMRLIHAGLQNCPAMKHMRLDEPAKWASLADSGQVDEVATVAVHPSRRDGQIFLNLVRLAYRSARARGITHLIMTIEPDRAAAMNREFEFRYLQIGPDQHYREESQTTAPFALSLDEQDRHLEERYPLYMEWFRAAPFDPRGGSPLRAERTTGPVT